MTRILPATLAAMCLLLTGCASNGAASPTPSDTSAGPGSQGTPAATSDEAFCDAVVAWAVASESMSATVSELGASLDAVDDPSEIPSPEALHGFGTAILTSADEVDAALADALAQVDDAVVADQFTRVNSLMLDMARWMGEAARDAEDFVAFSIEIVEGMDQIEAASAEMESLDASEADAYTMDHCGFLPGYTGNDGRLEDTQAKADVATLGKEIATYYVDNDESDPVPTITIEGSSYYLLDTNIGPVAPNVTLTGQYYASPIDWCVGVTNPLGTVKDFTYSAENGLQEGTCT